MTEGCWFPRAQKAGSDFGKTDKFLPSDEQRVFLAKTLIEARDTVTGN